MGFKKSNEKLPLIKKLKSVSSLISKQNLTKGALRLKSINLDGAKFKSKDLEKWYFDNKLGVVLNHETRGHILTDIVRYSFAASFAEVQGNSPRGHNDYDYVGLAPRHKNWTSGKFIDRFKVQERNKPASTITSHIAKDGHYFIHYDPVQARSMTVREAARIQTFPDNYFFQGPRTQQYQQVGNAVPPLLALKIANVVLKILLKK